ncbi:MAG: PEP-utilizing enzyme [Chloroflexota bacterium]|nr:PEP-utilizing enzyme [Chloroflexota bacterium]
MTAATGEAFVVPLAAPGASLERVGGKGAALANLAAAGFPVPPGFQITTAAYRSFVAENALQSTIATALRGLTPDDPASLPHASDTIRDAFLAGVIPDVIAAEIATAYATLGERAVAVRSSATAEDLPGLSFAGQQETLLNVRGGEAVRDAVRRCWASLWTARAIGYRRQMNVPADDVAMAVVVQQMVPAEMAGVLFTANPTTGARGELVVEAVPGLGEALVSGEVTPESYLIDRERLEATASAMAEYEGRLLTPAVLRDLAQLGLRVERHFSGVPQDIEWAIAGSVIWLLQARPITNLPAAPLADVRWESPRPGATWVRRQVVEHMPEPLSTLFADLYLDQGLQESITRIGQLMGLGDDFAAFVDGPFFTTVNGYGYSRANFNVNWKTTLLLLKWMVQGPIMIFRQGISQWRETGLPQYLAVIARWQEVDPETASDEELLRGIRELALADAIYWFSAALVIGAAKVSDALLEGILPRIAPGHDLHSGQFLRGFSSPMLQAEVDLDAIARSIRASDELREVVTQTPAERLLDALPQTPVGEAVRDGLRDYFARYGHQIYNLDFVDPTLVESPLPVFLALKALIREPGQAAMARQRAVTRERDRLTAEVADTLDPLRRFVFTRVVHWAQHFAPYREDALFFVGAAWPLLRRFARGLGERLARAGMLDAEDDVYFLDSSELQRAITDRAAGVPRRDLAGVARERRDLREARKRLHPPAAVPPESGMRVGRIDLSDRETQRRNAAGATTLRGFAVSPGRVTAPASVILSPDDFDQMEPGTILVCPTTTPAWTPLFAQTRGLVTDIGGILAHGSIVAREFGIPAVMGTGNATQRIISGQQITVDGSAGTVELEFDRPGPAGLPPALAEPSIT